MTAHKNVIIELIYLLLLYSYNFISISTLRVIFNDLVEAYVVSYSCLKYYIHYGHTLLFLTYCMLIDMFLKEWFVKTFYCYLKLRYSQHISVLTCSREFYIKYFYLSQSKKEKQNSVHNTTTIFKRLIKVR